MYQGKKQIVNVFCLHTQHAIANFQRDVQILILIEKRTMTIVAK